MTKTDLDPAYKYRPQIGINYPVLIAMITSLAACAPSSASPDISGPDGDGYKTATFTRDGQFLPLCLGGLVFNFARMEGRMFVHFPNNPLQRFNNETTEVATGLLVRDRPSGNRVVFDATVWESGDDCIKNRPTQVPPTPQYNPKPLPSNVGIAFRPRGNLSGR